MHVRNDGKGNEENSEERENETDDEQRENGERHDLTEQAKPECFRKALLHRFDDAVHVRLGEDQNAETDDREDGEPPKHQLDRLPGRERSARLARERPQWPVR